MMIEFSLDQLIIVTFVKVLNVITVMFFNLVLVDLFSEQCKVTFSDWPCDGYNVSVEGTCDITY